MASLLATMVLRAPGARLTLLADRIA